MQSDEPKYVGFWARVGASIIDMILTSMITLPILFAYYGGPYFMAEEFSPVNEPVYLVVCYIFPAVAVLWFWIAKQATPGKMAVSARVVDAKTGEPASKGRLIARYLGYYVSIIPLGLGLVWVAFDRRKQGWHDKLAGTVVVKKQKRDAKPASVDG